MMRYIDFQITAHAINGDNYAMPQTDHSPSQIRGFWIMLCVIAIVGVIAVIATH